MTVEPLDDSPTARQFLAEAWAVYRREVLLVLPTTFVLRVSVSVFSVLIVEIPVTLLHLVSIDPLSTGFGPNGELYLSIGLAAMWASFGHLLLAGVLERVVGSERHGHPKPSLGETFRRLPWGRLVAADLLLTSVTVALLMACVVPALLARPFLACAMPLLSMRHENLRTVWRATFELVSGHWWAVAAAGVVAYLAEAILMQGGAALVGELTHNHTVEVIVHGLLGIVVLPFGALVPVVITFDLLERRGEQPVERY